MLHALQMWSRKSSKLTYMSLKGGISAIEKDKVCKSKSRQAGRRWIAITFKVGVMYTYVHKELQECSVHYVVRTRRLSTARLFFFCGFFPKHNRQRSRPTHRQALCYVLPMYTPVLVQGAFFFWLLSTSPRVTVPLVFRKVVHTYICIIYAESVSSPYHIPPS